MVFLLSKLYEPEGGMEEMGGFIDPTEFVASLTPEEQEQFGMLSEEDQQAYLQQL